MSLLRDRQRRPVITYRIAMGRPGNPDGRGRDRSPQELDHFEVTRPGVEEGHLYAKAQEVHDIVGDKPRRLNIIVASDDIEDFVDQRYEARAKMGGRVVVYCHGDGRTAKRRVGDGPDDVVEVECRAAPRRENGSGYYDRTPRELAEGIDSEFKRKEPPPRGAQLRCPFAQNKDHQAGPMCKPRTKMLCNLVDSPRLGGVSRFQSSGHNTADGIVGSLLAIKEMTGGFLAGVPLALVLERKQIDYGGRRATHSVAHVELAIDPRQALELAVGTHRRKAELLAEAREVRGLLAEPVALGPDAAEFDGEIVEVETEVGARAAAEEAPSGAMGEE